MNMKQRQTFTLSPEVSNRAKHFARKQGISLSSLVEQLLCEKTSLELPPKKPSKQSLSFSDRWTGKGVLAKKSDERTRYLSKKYKL